MNEETVKRLDSNWLSGCFVGVFLFGGLCYMFLTWGYLEAIRKAGEENRIVNGQKIEMLHRILDGSDVARAKILKDLHEARVISELTARKAGITGKQIRDAINPPPAVEE